ncbi:MAG: hypothetical protein NVSMB52_05810 [Chloroflexota bacterium]
MVVIRLVVIEEAIVVISAGLVHPVAHLAQDVGGACSGKRSIVLAVALSGYAIGHSR